MQIIINQCETMINALDTIGIDTEFFKTEFCDQMANNPDERSFSELVDVLEGEVRKHNLIDTNELEIWKWLRYEEHDLAEQNR